MLWPWPFPNRRAYSAVNQVENPKSEHSVDEREESYSRNEIRVFLFSILGINLIILFFAIQSFAYEPRPTNQDIRLLNTPVPPFNRKVRVFTEEPGFVARPSPESDAAWESLNGPPSDHPGFVWIDNAEIYGLNSTTRNDGKQMFGVSMLHQLHCLGGIRKMFWDILEGRIDRQDLLEEYPEDMAQPSFKVTVHGLWHIGHCFDYIRQSIQCAGDMSLEWPIEVNGNNLIAGWDNPHECRDWDSAWKFLEDNS